MLDYDMAGFKIIYCKYDDYIKICQLLNIYGVDGRPSTAPSDEVFIERVIDNVSAQKDDRDLDLQRIVSLQMEIERLQTAARV